MVQLWNIEGWPYKITYLNKLDNFEMKKKIKYFDKNRVDSLS